MHKVKSFYIKSSSIQGKGVFAAKNIKKGEHILFVAGQKIKRYIKTPEESKRYENWVGIKKDKWLNVVRPYRYLNHSCNPNTAITNTYSLVALKNIRKDTEIVFDYSLTDDDQFWEMKCNCDSKKCRKVIRYVRDVSPSVFGRHFPHTPEYFQRVYLHNYITNGHKRNRKW